MKTDTSNTEREIAELKQKITDRAELMKSPAARDETGKAYTPRGHFGGRSKQFMDSLRVRLRELQAQLLHLKVEAGDLDPEQILEIFS